MFHSYPVDGMDGMRNKSQPPRHDIFQPKKKFYSSRDLLVKKEEEEDFF